MFIKPRIASALYFNRKSQNVINSRLGPKLTETDSALSSSFYVSSF